MATEQADLIRQMRQRQGELERKVGQFAGMSTGTTIGVDVRAVGARGDGVTDDAAAIQEAIDRARDIGTTYTGAIVYFPPGEYLVQSPLILPRTGLTPSDAVWLVGANTRSSRIVGGSSMVSGESVIMWEDTLARAWHQCIRDLTIKAPEVAGTYAIHYKMNNTSPASSADYRDERLQIKMANVLVEAHNDYNLYGCKLEGNLYACDFDTIYLDPALGSATNDTALFKFDTPIFVGLNEDGAGLGYSSMRHIHTTIRRGGYGAIIIGRLNRVQIDTIVAGLGCKEDPIIDIANSFQVTITNLFSEAQGEQPQLKFSNCRGIHMTNYTLGTPVDVGAGVGNGMELYTVRDSTFTNMMRVHNAPTFNSLGVKAVVLDAASRNNRFWMFHLSDDIADEITDNGSKNYFEGWNIAGTPAFQASGDFLAGDLNATGGYRQLVDGWNIASPGASASNVRLRRFMEAATSTLDVWRPPRAGSITGIIARATSRTAGTMTVKVNKNGTDVLSTTIDATTGQQSIETFAKDAITFAAGDAFYMAVSTTADWLPVNADVWAAFEVET